MCNEFIKKVEELSLQSEEVLEDISSDEFDVPIVQWFDQVDDFGRRKYLSTYMDKADFIFRYNTNFVEDVIYLPEDIHVNGFFHQFQFNGECKRIHMNYVCLDMAKDFYSIDSTKFTCSNYCDWFNSDANFGQFVNKWKESMFCDMCHCFLFEYDVHQYNPCETCINNYNWWN